MKITIIGGSGFVGTRLIEHIGPIFCKNIDKKPSHHFPEITSIYDIRNKNLESTIDPETDIVILLAAEHKDNVEPVSLYYDVNVEGTKNVLDVMDKMGIKKILFTSSVAIYGLNKKNPDEDFNPEPFNHYGKSKWLAEEVLREWFTKDPLNRSLIIIRPTVIFGEQNRGNVYNLLKQINSGLFIMVGDGNNKKSMAYVENVVSFIKFCIDNFINKPGYYVFNYSDKPDLTMNEFVLYCSKILGKKIPSIKLPYWIGISIGVVADFFSKITGKKLLVSSLRIKKFCATTQIDSSKAFNYGFKPKFTINEALERTIKFEFLNGRENKVVFFTE